jgi:PAS domain-containing protein
VVGIDIETIDRKFGAFRRRMGELKEVSPRPARRPEELLEATLAELDLAEEELQVCLEEINSQRSASESRGEDEWWLLTKTFAELPVPVLLLDTDGGIRRSNEAGAALIGTSHKYLTRRPLAGLIDLTTRAAYRSELSRVVRDGTTSTVPVRLTAQYGGQALTLTLRRITPRDETRRTVIVVLWRDEQRPGTDDVASVVPRPAGRSAVGGTFLLNISVSVARAAGEAAARANQALADAHRDVRNLVRALDSRTVVGQATGIVMAQRGFTADKAFDALVRASQHHNVKLVRLAERLVSDPRGEHGI